MEVALFYLFGAGAVLSACNVVLRRQPVSAALWMVVAFFFLAGCYLLLGFPFLAAVQVMVYAGAIMVLVLFVIMLLDQREASDIYPQTRMGAAVGLAAVLAATAIAAAAGASAAEGAEAVEMTPLIRALFEQYLLPFEATSLLLVAAIVGALSIGRNEKGGAA